MCGPLCQIYVATCAPARDPSAGYIAWGHSTLVGPVCPSSSLFLHKFVTEINLKKQAKQLDKTSSVPVFQTVICSPLLVVLQATNSSACFELIILFIFKLMVQLHFCFLEISPQYNMWFFLSLICIHSYWTLAFILSWEAVWADCSNYWAWTDNSDRRDWLFSNWKNKVSTSFSFHPITHVSVYCCLYLHECSRKPLYGVYTMMSMIIVWHNAFHKNAWKWVAIAFGK